MACGLLLYSSGRCVYTLSFSFRAPKVKLLGGKSRGRASPHSLRHSAAFFVCLEPEILCSNAAEKINCDCRCCRRFSRSFRVPVWLCCADTVWKPCWTQILQHRDTHRSWSQFTVPLSRLRLFRDPELEPLPHLHLGYASATTLVAPSSPSSTILIRRISLPDPSVALVTQSSSSQRFPLG